MDEHKLNEIEALKRWKILVFRLDQQRNSHLLNENASNSNAGTLVWKPRNADQWQE